MQKKNYITVAKHIKTETIINKSRFIGQCFCVPDVEIANEKLADVRKEYWDARHHCYAYIIDAQTIRYSDDGEPSGTGGLPIMDVLQKKQLQQVLVVVTRYFGGVLLGAGRLARAYSNACSETTTEAGIVKYCVCDGIRLDMEYPMLGKIEYFLQSEEIFSEEPVYTDKVSIEVWLPQEETSQFLEQITLLSDGRIKPLLLSQQYKALPTSQA